MLLAAAAAAAERNPLQTRCNPDVCVCAHTHLVHLWHPAAVCHLHRGSVVSS